MVITRKTSKGRYANSRWDNNDMTALAEMYTAGASYEKMGIILGRSRGSIRQRIGIIRTAYKLRERIDELEGIEVLRKKKKATDQR